MSDWVERQGLEFGELKTIGGELHQACIKNDLDLREETESYIFTRREKKKKRNERVVVRR